MGDANKLYLPVTILLSTTILGGFYYASESNKQKSIERQLEMKIAEERRIEEKEDQVKRAEAEAKIYCAQLAEANAVQMYKSYCESNPSYCADYKEGFYNVKQYENSYNKCLQDYGWK